MPASMDTGGDTGTSGMPLTCSSRCNATEADAVHNEDGDYNEMAGQAEIIASVRQGQGRTGAAA